MTTTEPSKPRRRRGKRGCTDQTVCVREGCHRVIASGDFVTCSLLCRAIDDELAEAERVCAATGDTEHWLAAVELNDCLSRFNASDTRIRRAALESGISAEAWRSIKRGE